MPDDDSAFEHLVAKFYPAVRVAAYRTLCGAGYDRTWADDEAQDVAQRIFASIWRRKGGAALRSEGLRYFASAARYEALKIAHRRQMPRRAGVATIDGDIANDDPFHEVWKAEMRDHVSRALEGLPRRAREAAYLTYCCGLTHAEVGSQMGIGAKGVEKALHRARALLARDLAPLAADFVPEIVDGAVA